MKRNEIMASLDEAYSSSILHSISSSLGFPLGVLLVIVGEKKPLP
jgi:hypothetical protein